MGTEWNAARCSCVPSVSSTKVSGPPGSLRVSWGRKCESIEWTRKKTTIARLAMGWQCIACNETVKCRWKLFAVVQVRSVVVHITRSAQSFGGTAVDRLSYLDPMSLHALYTNIRTCCPTIGGRRGHLNFWFPVATGTFRPQDVARYFFFL